MAYTGGMDRQRKIPAAMLAIGVGVLGYAYTAQFGFGVEPCALCLWQRLPYGVTALLGLGALLRRQTGAGLRRLLMAAALIYGAGGGVAVYHVGVEQHWWASAAGCGDAGGGAMTLEDMKKALTSKPAKACDEVDWTLFGISMATYNVGMSLGLAVIALGFRRRMGTRP